MKKEQIIISNYGILTSISWNSNKWAGAASEVDIEKSKYGYVKKIGRMNESLNFVHEDLPPNEDGYYIGSTPIFNRPPAHQNSKNVDIIFFISSNYKKSNEKNIVGFYGLPIFGGWYERTAKHKLFEGYNKGNIKALPENIIFFDNPIVIDNELVQKRNLLPPGKKISQQGFNYLNSDNVNNIIKEALPLNSRNNKLREFIDRFPL